MFSIDVSKDRLDDAAGAEALAAPLAGLAVVSPEATDGFETLTSWMLVTAGLPVVVNSAQVRSSADALDQRAEADPIDAAKGVKARPLTGQQTRVFADVDGRVRASGAWRLRDDLLLSTPRVAEDVSRTLIAGLLGVGSLDRRAHRKGAVHLSGRQMARQELHFRRQGECPRGPLHGRPRRVRESPMLKAFCGKLVPLGKPNIVAIITTPRTLLIILNTVIWDESHRKPLDFQDSRSLPYFESYDK